MVFSLGTRLVRSVQREKSSFKTWTMVTQIFLLVFLSRKSSHFSRARPIRSMECALCNAACCRSAIWKVLYDNTILIYCGIVPKSSSYRVLLHLVRTESASTFYEYDMRRWHTYRQSTEKRWFVVSRVRYDDKSVTIFVSIWLGFTEDFFRLCIPDHE